MTDKNPHIRPDDLQTYQFERILGLKKLNLTSSLDLGRFSK